VDGLADASHAVVSKGHVFPESQGRASVDALLDVHSRRVHLIVE
jgi:hypothetical protein